MIKKRNPVWSEMSKLISVRVVNKKILCFHSSKIFLSHFLRARVTWQTSDVSKPQKDSKATLFLAPPNLLHVEFRHVLYMPMTLEGGGTISQLSNATAEKSCTVKGHSQFHECKTKRQSTLHLQYILWGRVMKFEWDYCLFSESRVVHTKAWIVLLVVQLKGSTVYTWAVW